MKYLVLLCDGMADRPLTQLGGKTPMEKAVKPNMDMLAGTAEVGLVRTVAPSLKPGSDVANLSVMGYDPTVCYTGRSPLEAVSIGVDLKDTDVALRCNLVTLSDDETYENKAMVDYCAGDISTEEAAQIIETVDEILGGDGLKFYSGVSYRHCLVVENGTTDLGDLTPPHDISGRVIGKYLSDNTNAARLVELMKKSYDILMKHPVNLKRISQGKRPANSIWLWGEGTKPQLESFYEKYNKTCAVISAVDLLKGIGHCAGMTVENVEGATGYIDTDFSAKATAAIRLFRSGTDVVYLHIEAPDECGHRGEIDNKVKSIEMIDSLVLGPILEAIRPDYDCKILILPDHPTPLSIKTHSSDPVPYLIFDSTKQGNGVDCFCEQEAEKTGNFIDFGPSLMEHFLNS